MQKAVELLQRLADEVQQSMGQAADSLAGQSLPDTANSQSQAVEKIDQIFMAVAPYANLVRRGIDRQEELINQSPAAENQGKSGEQNTAAKQAQPQPEAEAQPQSEAQARNSISSFDGAEAAWNQRFVARYGRILAAKARRELEQLDATPQGQPAPPAQSAASTEPNANAGQSPDKDQQSDEQLKAAEQRKDLKEALQLGVQSAPKVEQLAQDAAQLLEDDKPAEALPKQQEALKLLKDMLPKQQQDQDKKDQDKKDQDKKDRQKKDQDKKDQNKKDQEKKDQKQQQQDQQKDKEKKDQERKGQNKQDQQKKNQENSQQQQKPQEQNNR